MLDAERRLYASQTEVARSSVTIGTNLIAIYKALGGGWNLEDPAATVAAMDKDKDKPATQTVAVK